MEKRLEAIKNIRLDAYPALIGLFDDNPDIAASWNAEYYLGTYAALKEYAYVTVKIRIQR